MRPEHADFGVTIDFAKGESDPVQTFQAMVEFLDAFRKIDGLLIDSIDTDIHATVVLEDVEAGSITSWVRNKISAVDDQALKEFNIEKQVGKYAVRAKYKVIEYLDAKEERDERYRLDQLREDLYQLASETKTRPFPLPDHIPLDELVKPLDQIQDAKRLMGPDDAVTIKSEDREKKLELTNTKKPSEFLGEQPPEASSGTMEMVLLVRKPDYLGNSLWEFRHGRSAISAHVMDAAWLARFRAGQEIIVPGSALACTVRYEYRYTDEGAVSSIRHEIVKVHKKIDPAEVQDDLPNV